MQSLIRIAVCALVWCGGAWFVFVAEGRGQQSVSNEKGVGTITGRVTSEEKGLAGVTVGVMPSELSGRWKPLARATTDAEGRYTLTGVPAGRYQVLPIAPAFVWSETTNNWPPGKQVNLSAGETVEGMDFSLTRGGVITGRVTDADGRPLIAQLVRVARADRPQEGFSPLLARGGTDATDDRGVYRIYGLPPGRYRVSTGEADGERGAPSYAGGRPIYMRTFYPGVTEEAQARLVEVTSGGEATDIDITLGAPAKTFKVAGRVSEGETGRALANISVLFGPLARGSQGLMGAFGGGAPSNERGEFQFYGLLPGRYSLFVAGGEQSDWYSEALTFEVSDADVSGLELRVRRGASISGVITLEGTSDRAVFARLTQLMLSAQSLDKRTESSIPFGQAAQINADGSFRIPGLRPGRVQLVLSGWPQQRSFSLLRVERGGVEVREGIDVQPGENVTGVRLVVAYGSGVIRGQVTSEHGALPVGVRMDVIARRVGSESNPQFSRASVDGRGRFTLEGLRAGAYELTLRVAPPPGREQPSEIKQSVVVGEGGETPVTFVYQNP